MLLQGWICRLDMCSFALPGPFPQKLTLCNIDLYFIWYISILLLLLFTQSNPANNSFGGLFSLQRRCRGRFNTIKNSSPRLWLWSKLVLLWLDLFFKMKEITVIDPLLSHVAWLSLKPEFYIHFFSLHFHRMRHIHSSDWEVQKQVHLSCTGRGGLSVAQSLSVAARLAYLVLGPPSAR